MTFNRHEFWKDPDASSATQDIKDICRPEYYLHLDGITNLIVNALRPILDDKDTIVELGCGTGRNLAGLKKAGFKNLSGVEINAHAIEIGRKAFAYLVGVPIICSPVEDAINDLPETDCIFTQGFLQHLSPDTDWVHKVMTEKARKYIMVIENEQPFGERSWARNYNKVFTNLGWQEVENKSNTRLPGHAPTSTLRLFKKV
jgi:SAM-dependent methyltransferase